MQRRFLSLIILITVLAVAVTSCAPAPAAPAAATSAPAAAATTAPAAQEAAAPTEAAQPAAATQAPAAQAGTLATVAREDTAIFDIDGGRYTAPDLFNRFAPGNCADNGFGQAMLEPFFTFNFSGADKYEPWLGESVTHNDKFDEWTLKIRKGITWNDGQPFNTDDIVFTYDMLAKHAPDLTYSAGVSETIKSVEKVDDLTVKFTLKKADPRFDYDYLAVRIGDALPIMPKHIWESQDPLTFKNFDLAKGWPVTTGAYKLVRASETEFIYDRDDNWWGAKTGFRPLPQPKRLIWTWLGPEDTRVAAMADHRLDSLMDVTLGAFQALQARNPNIIAWTKDLPYTWPDPCPRNIEVNDAVAPWNDKDMRWALNDIINRDQVVQIAYEGTSTTSRLFFPPYTALNRYDKLLEDAGLFAKYPVDKNDPEKAAQILTSKGYAKGGDGFWAKDGKKLAVTIDVPDAWVEIQRNGQIVVEQLQNFGIDAQMRTLAVGPFFDNWAMGNFELMSGWFTCGSVYEPWTSMNTFNMPAAKVGVRADANQWRWSGPQHDAFDKIVDQMGTLAPGDPQMDKLFVQAMTIWLDELPTIPLAKSKKLIPFDTTYWTNWPSADNNYMAGPTWLQNSIVIIHNIQKVKK